MTFHILLFQQKIILDYEMHEKFKLITMTACASDTQWNETIKMKLEKQKCENKEKNSENNYFQNNTYLR